MKDFQITTISGVFMIISAVYSLLFSGSPSSVEYYGTVGGLIAGGVSLIKVRELPKFKDGFKKPE